MKTGTEGLKQLHPVWALVLGVILYLQKFTIGGVLGDVFAIFGFILVVLAIASLLEKLFKKKKDL